MSRKPKGISELSTLTAPADTTWDLAPTNHRRWEKSQRVGEGAAHWAAASASVLNWEVKTRSGFTVTPAAPASLGARPFITVGFGPIKIVEPVEVVALVHCEDRVGFAYRTLPGHPVSGEECFVLERRSTGNYLLMRSLTSPADTLGWRLLFPLLLVAQRVTRIRYFRALRELV